MTLYVSTLVLVVFGVWATWAEIDQITRVPGKVIPSSRNQVIQVPDPGMVEAILVKEGDMVRKGQLLMRFDKVKANAAYLEHMSRFVSLQASVARLRAEIFGGAIQFPAELSEYPELRENAIALYNARRAALAEDVSLLEQNRQLVLEELSLSEPLLASGDVSKVDVLRLRRQAVDLASRIALRRNKYKEDAQADLAKAQENLEGVTQVVAQVKKSLESTEIVAPMDGIVRNIRITTLGGVARAGEEIMQIVPVDDELLFECKVKPRDVAFISENMPATIKLDAYDYTIYGTLSGKVTFISADTMIDEVRMANEEPYYRVHVKASGKIIKGHGKDPVEIQPGMTSTVEIKTGSNTVAKYLLKPVTKTISESLGER